MQDTLSYHQGRPFTRIMDLSKVPVAAVAKQWPDIKAFLNDRDGGVQNQPEQEALWFYLKNHVVAEIALRFDEDEPLPPKINALVEDYHTTMHLKSLRMFYYLLQITTRESRHAGASSGLADLYKKAPAVRDFHKQLRSMSSTTDFFANNPPKMPLGDYVRFIEEQFTAAQYGGAFGGKPWANITKCLRHFIEGKITAEMMLDTSFALEHNTGTMFNKGMVYEHAEVTRLKQILDVQRSGQIPQYVQEQLTYASAEMAAYLNTVANLLPGFGEGYVDWYLVEKLGAVNKYPIEKAAQDKTYGLSSTLSTQEKVAKFKEKIAASKYQQQLAEYKKTHFEVTPDVYVKKVARQSA